MLLMLLVVLLHIDCWDQTEVGSMIFPINRRDVRRDLETGHVIYDAPSGFILDFVKLTFREESGGETRNFGACGDFGPHALKG